MKEREMTPEVIRERLSSLRELDFAGAERLAEEMAKDAREPLGSLARTLEWSKYHDRSKVESVLKLLDELSILPWLSASRNLKGTNRTQALSEAYRIYQDLDRRVIEKLRGMLKEQTPIPPAASTGPIEVPVAVTRVCDEAYLLLRHLDKPDEADADDRRYRLSFARMTEEERDGRIGHYVQTGEFK
jgi:hypothetical protein